MSNRTVTEVMVRTRFCLFVPLGFSGGELKSAQASSVDQEGFKTLWLKYRVSRDPVPFVLHVIAMPSDESSGITSRLIRGGKLIPRYV